MAVTFSQSAKYPQYGLPDRQRNPYCFCKSTSVAGEMAGTQLNANSAMRSLIDGTSMKEVSRA